MKKSIVIVVENLPVPPDRRVWNEAKALAGAGFNVSIISPKGKGFYKSKETIDNIDIYRVGFPLIAGKLGYVIEYMIFIFFELIVLLNISRKNKIDVIQICNPPDILVFPAKIIKSLYRSTIVYDQHDLVPEMTRVKFNSGSGLLYKIMLLLEKMTYRMSDFLIANNESVRDVAIDRGSFNRSNIQIVRNGPSRIAFKPNTARREASEILLGYIGIIGEQDGLDTLMYAIKILQDEGIAAKLSVVGDGPALDKIKLLALELGVEKSVKFHGFVSGATFGSLISEFDIGVAPDMYNEYSDKCTLNKVVEYMALGIPCVMFKLKENMVTAGDAGIYAEEMNAEALARAIRWCIENWELSQEKAQMGLKEFNENLCWEVQERKLIDFYKKII